MTEEEKQNSVEEKKPAGEAKQETKPGKPEKAKEPAENPSARKKKKISQMTLVEIDQELKKIQSAMGGFASAHARHLLAKKTELTKS